MSHYNNIRNVYKDKCYVKDIYIYIWLNVFQMYICTNMYMYVICI